MTLEDWDGICLKARTERRSEESRPRSTCFHVDMPEANSAAASMLMDDCEALEDRRSLIVLDHPQPTKRLVEDGETACHDSATFATNDDPFLCSHFAKDPRPAVHNCCTT